MIKIPKVSYTCNDGYPVTLTEPGSRKYAIDGAEVAYKAVNTDFDVTINGLPCEVKHCRVSALPFNRPWPGFQRDLNQSEDAGFIAFSADEAVELRVRRKQSFDSALIRPLSKSVTAEVCDGEVVFTLSDYGSYVLEFGNTHNVLHIFFDPIKEYPEAKDATVYFGPGMHFPGVINLRDHDTVYIDREAIVFGSIFAKGVKNVRIFGGGVLDNSCEARLLEHCYAPFTKGCFRIYESENIDVSDIILLNSSTWVMSMFWCHHVKIDNVKIVGQWRYNTDGIDVVNSDHVCIKNCFIRSFDDTISIKAIYDYQKPIEEITVENCVLWCGWGKTCEIGIETQGIEYKNIAFRNCDAIHNAYGIMTISNGNYADMHHISFEDMRIEMQRGNPQILQTSQAQKYDSKGEELIPNLIANVNKQFFIRKSDDSRDYDVKFGNIHDITYRNIRVTTEGDAFRPVIRIKSLDANVIFKSFHFENLYLNGEKQTDFGKFSMDVENAENISIS